MNPVHIQYKCAINLCSVYRRTEFVIHTYQIRLIVQQAAGFFVNIYANISILEIETNIMLIFICMSKFCQSCLVFHDLGGSHKKF